VETSEVVKILLAHHLKELALIASAIGAECDK
jgi:hypothetical protein